LRSPIKILAYVIIASIVFSSCSGSSSKEPDNETSVTKIPNMSNKVVSYQRVTSYQCHEVVREAFEAKEIITDKDTLKSCFSDIFDNEQNGCNYFAISFAGSRYAYYVLSQDMVLYLVKADINGDENFYCRGGNGNIEYDLMLVCDDVIGTLKNSIDYDNVQSYTDPDWDCKTETVFTKNVFF